LIKGLYNFDEKEIRVNNFRSKRGLKFKLPTNVKSLVKSLYKLLMLRAHEKDVVDVDTYDETKSSEFFYIELINIAIPFEGPSQFTFSASFAESSDINLIFGVQLLTSLVAPSWWRSASTTMSSTMSAAVISFIPFGSIISVTSVPSLVASAARITSSWHMDFELFIRLIFN
jgi:hypothetical protein